jgi:arylsulfatase A
MNRYALLLSTIFITCTYAEDRPPNVILMMADDMGYGDLGCFGRKDISTPNLDALAASGIRFTDFYVPQAVCSASRTGLLTGCYPNRLSILGALSPRAKTGINSKETVLGEVFKARGYATAIYGKWHLGDAPEFLPTNHGFDEYYGLPYSNDMWPPRFIDLPLIDNTKTIALNPDQTKLTTDYTQRAVQFIEKNKDKPFFIYMPQSMPHVPLFVSDRQKGKSKGGLYGDVIEEIDWSMGQVVATLKKHSLDRNTLVIFLSDNGPWLPYGNHSGVTGGLREGKGTSFEGGVRVPFIASWPEHIPAGSVCSTPAMSIDLLPTLANIIGGKTGDLPIDGKNIAPLLLAEKEAVSPQKAYFIYWDRELQAVRYGKWKLHFPHNYRQQINVGMDGKSAPYGTGKIGLALFDLVADREEKNDVAAQNPEIVAQIQKLADEMREDLGDSLLKKVGKNVRQPGRIVEKK